MLRFSMILFLGTFSLSFAQNKRPTLSPSEAKQKAEQRYGGKALSADPQNQGAPAYKVKIIQEGRVKTVQIPAVE